MNGPSTSETKRTSNPIERAKAWTMGTAKRNRGSAEAPAKINPDSLAMVLRKASAAARASPAMSATTAFTVGCVDVQSYSGCA